MLEIWSGADRRLVPLAGSTLTFGADSANDIVIDDPAVSRLHGLFERHAAGWTVTDLGSRNGTFVNGARIFVVAGVHGGDRIRLGSTEIVFRADDANRPVTASLLPPPQLTPRERDVLLALCMPLIDSDMFCAPASLRDIAVTLSISEDAVKKHLTRLYAKFGVDAPSASRRAQLANQAVSSGAINIAELKR
jgi:pSer/pThr/pTyr-binding forkhead associated (FHA) protein